MRVATSIIMVDQPASKPRSRGHSTLAWIGAAFLELSIRASHVTSVVTIMMALLGIQHRLHASNHQSES